MKAKLVFPYNYFDEILVLEQETSPFLNLTFTPFKEDIIKRAMFGLRHFENTVPCVLRCCNANILNNNAKWQ
jgi:hypothetical protein